MDILLNNAVAIVWLTVATFIAIKAVDVIVLRLIKTFRKNPKLMATIQTCGQCDFGKQNSRDKPCKNCLSAPTNFMRTK